MPGIQILCIVLLVVIGIPWLYGIATFDRHGPSRHNQSGTSINSNSGGHHFGHEHEPN